MALKDWKKSQTGSGFYKKEIGKLPKFIKFEQMDKQDYGEKNYRVYSRTGIGNRPQKTLGYFKTKSQALKFAKSYMNRNPSPYLRQIKRLKS